MADVKDVTLRTLKAKDKAYTYPIGSGLTLLIKPNATKLWEFRYTSPTLHKRRKSSLGKYPSVTLSMAKKKADEYRELIARELDPIDYKKEIREDEIKKQSSLFVNVVDEWFEIQKDDLASSTFMRKKNQFINDVNPFFINRTIETIKHSELVKILELKKIKAPESANRLYSYFNNLWQYATTKGYCDFNIVSNIHKKSIIKSRVKKHYSKITDINILKILIHNIYNYKGNYSTRNALKFVLHLPLRATNLINLKWEHINFNTKILTIPRAEMKVKNINMPDFKMPLTDEVINILEEQRLFSNGSYVFSSSGYSNKPICIETPNRALQRMGFNDEAKGNKIRLHGFRGTFRSLADTYNLSHNISKEAKEGALDHLPKNVSERAYTHEANYIQELEILMNWWSDFIVKLKEE